MICLECNEPTIVVEYEQIELDVCPTCRGVWFDANELDILLESLGLPADPEELMRVGREGLPEKKRRCPYCRHKMQEVHIGDRGVVIDRCPRGHGLYFDGGELDTVIEELQHTTGAGEIVGSFLSHGLFTDEEADEENTESGDET